MKEGDTSRGQRPNRLCFSSQPSLAGLLITIFGLALAIVGSGAGAGAVMIDPRRTEPNAAGRVQKAAPSTSLLGKEQHGAFEKPPRETKTNHKAKTINSLKPGNPSSLGPASSNFHPNSPAFPGTRGAPRSRPESPAQPHPQAENPTTSRPNPKLPEQTEITREAPWSLASSALPC